jgi:hypothetical protein
MARKRHSAEQIIQKLREAEIALSQGKTVALPARPSRWLSRLSTAGAIGPLPDRQLEPVRRPGSV